MRSLANGSRYSAAFSIALLALAPATSAAPLAKDACDALKTEQYGLVATGLRSEMARGAVWAKANLTGDRMKSIQRLIEVDEQILFRCASQRAAANSDGQDDDDGKDATPKPKPKPAAKPKAAKPAEAVAGAEAPPAAVKDGELKPDAGQALAPVQPPKKDDAQPAKKRAAEANPKPKPKPKAEAKDDAFVPPEGAPLSVLKPPAGVPAVPAGAQ